MASSGILLTVISTQPVISILGGCIGRGTIISMALVLFVLPGILVLGDKIIEKTSFEMKGIELGEREENGTMLVNGRVRGYVAGYMDAEVNGALHGRVHALIATGDDLEVLEEDPDAVEKAKAELKNMQSLNLHSSITEAKGKGGVGNEK